MSNPITNPRMVRGNSEGHTVLLGVPGARRFPRTASAAGAASFGKGVLSAHTLQVLA